MKKPYSLVMLIPLLFSGLALAGPEISIETIYYEVSGESEQEIRSSLNSRSPVRVEEGVFDAHTSWHVNWRFNWRTHNESCFITRVNTTLDVKYILPKWDHTQSSNNGLIRKWSRYYEALIAHEEGHKAFGVRAAEDIEAAISIMPSFRECTTLEQRANELAQRIFEDYVEREKDYDRETNHGLKYGAVFP